MPVKVHTKKSLCVEYGWSLNTLNKEIEIALPEIYKLIKGKKVISPKHYWMIKEALGEPTMNENS